MEDQNSRLDRRGPSSIDIVAQQLDSGISKVKTAVRRTILPIAGAAIISTASNPAKAETTQLPDDRSFSLTCPGHLTRTGNEIICNLAPTQPLEISVTKARRGSCEQNEDDESPVSPVGQASVKKGQCSSPSAREGNINDAYSYQTHTITFPEAGTGEARGEINLKTDNGTITYSVYRPEKPPTRNELNETFVRKDELPSPQQQPFYQPQTQSQPAPDQDSSNMRNDQWFNMNLGYQLELGDFQADKTNGGFIGAGMNFQAGEDSDWYYGGVLKYSQMKSNVELHNLDSRDPNISQQIKRLGIGPSLTYVPADWFGLNLNATGGLSLVNTGEIALRHDTSNNTYVLSEGEQMHPYFEAQLGPQVYLGPFVFGGAIGGVCTIGGVSIPDGRNQKCVLTFGASAGVQNK